MKLEKSMQLGELYRELRIARGLKLKDVARENLSVSQLSRFENGQSMLAADKLLIAISGIHMTFSEFGHAINNYQEPKYFQLSTKIAELYNKQDIEGLKALLESEKGSEVFDVYERLNGLIIKAYIYNLDPTYVIPEEETNFLTSYLYEIEEWTEFELFILNLIVLLVTYRKFYQATYFIESLEKIITYQDMLAMTYLNFLKKLIANLEDGTDDLSNLEHFIVCVEEIGNPLVASYLKMNLLRITNNSEK